MIEILGVLTAGAEIIRLLVQGVGFVERLFGGKPGQGETKKDLVMNFATIAFQQFGGSQDNARWEEAKPHVSVIVDEIVAVMNILGKKES